MIAAVDGTDGLHDASLLLVGVRTALFLVGAALVVPGDDCGEVPVVVSLAD